MTKMILIAGPYRSGTNDEMELIENNVKFMQRIALQVYRKGYLPVMGEWFALPLIEEAGSKEIGDEIFNEIFHPISIQLLDKCDGILRVGGPSTGADDMMRIGKEKSKVIYNSIEEIPTFNN
jgi:GDP-mannose pyrophosphatase NudK